VRRYLINFNVFAVLAASAFGETSSIASSHRPHNTRNASTVPLQSCPKNNSFVNFESPHWHPLNVISNCLLLAVNALNNGLEVYSVHDKLTDWASLMILTAGSISASLPATPENRFA
jgi:hypothetical protein